MLPGHKDQTGGIPPWGNPRTNYIFTVDDSFGTSCAAADIRKHAGRANAFTRTDRMIIIYSSEG